MNTQTPQQRIETFMAQCQSCVETTSRQIDWITSNRLIDDQLLVALVHDGAELTCPTLYSWWIREEKRVEAGVEVSGCYEMRKIDGDKATYEGRYVTVLALLPIR